MTGIISNAYVSGYSQNNHLMDRQQANLPQLRQQKSAAHHSAATNVTLSADAQAALAKKAQENPAELAATIRAKITSLLESLKRTSLLQDGKLAVDLSNLNGEEISSIARNLGNKFSDEEQKAAKQELEHRFDKNLKGAHAVTRVTGQYTDLYKAAQKYLEGMSGEDKKTADWQGEYSAVKKALQFLKDNPTRRPAGIPNDLVESYLKREAIGDIKKAHDITAIASDARTALDALKGNNDKTGDMASFGTRTLSAIALNKSDKFSTTEIIAAKNEVKARLGKSVQSALQASGSSGDPTSFSKRLIAQYSSMSAEEREAAGFDQAYYNAIVKNYETSLQISQAFGKGAGGSGLSLVNYL